MSLKEHIADMQRLACRLEGLMEGLTHLQSEGACSDAQMALSETALEIAMRLNSGLDSAALREVEQ